MDYLAIDNGPATYRMTVNRLLRYCIRERSVVGYQSEYAPFDKSNHYVFSFAQPRSAFGDVVKDGLQVSRRAGDYPEDLARRRLLLEGFFEFLFKRLDVLQSARGGFFRSPYPFLGREFFCRLPHKMIRSSFILRCPEAGHRPYRITSSRHSHGRQAAYPDRGSLLEANTCLTSAMKRSNV